MNSPLQLMLLPRSRSCCNVIVNTLRQLESACHQSRNGWVALILKLPNRDYTRDMPNYTVQTGVAIKLGQKNWRRVNKIRVAVETTISRPLDLPQWLCISLGYPRSHHEIADFTRISNRQYRIVSAILARSQAWPGGSPISWTKGHSVASR